MHSAHANPYFEICFRPTIATINDTRRMVTALYEPLLGDAEIASRLAVTTHELLENVLKYSIDGATVIRVEISRGEDARIVKVETRNSVSPKQRVWLEEVFAEMQRCGDADSYYEFVMQRSRRFREGSGLGLARIWAEAEMAVSLSTEGDEACIAAVAKILGGKVDV